MYIKKFSVFNLHLTAQRKRGCEKSDNNAFSFRGVDMPVAYWLGPEGLG